MSNSVGLTPAAGHALSGIRAAQDMLSRAARDVAFSSARGEFLGPPAKVQISEAGRAAATAGGDASQVSAPSKDLPSALVDTRIAAELQRANVAVLRTDDEMSRELSKLTSHKK
jgi:hypothetical protein